MSRPNRSARVEAGPKKHQSRNAQIRAHHEVQSNITRMTHPSGYPQRIVCLTEETTETLYLLEEDWRIVGISGFTVRPPRARKEKPRVSAFTSAKIDRIVDLQPDLVLGFSDLQADIAAELVRAGYRSTCVQSQQRRGDPAHDPHVGRDDRLRGEDATAGRAVDGGPAMRCGSVPRRCRAGRGFISKSGMSRRFPASVGYRS